MLPRQERIDPDIANLLQPAELHGIPQQRPDAVRVEQQIAMRTNWHICGTGKLSRQRMRPVISVRGSYIAWQVHWFTEAKINESYGLDPQGWTCIAQMIHYKNKD